LSSSWTWTPADPSTDDPYFEKMAAQGQSFFQAAGDSGEWNDEHNLPVGRCICHLCRRHGLGNQQRGRPLEASETAWVDGGGGYYAPDDILIPSWQQTSGRDHLSQQGFHGLPQRPGRLRKREFYLLRLRRPNHLQCKRIWRDQFCRAHVGRLPGSGQSTGGCQRQSGARLHQSERFIRWVSGPNYDTDFHDITSGSNGFPAATGYDLATGWGSPNGAA
jgi:hypothetical protein